mmetsp:Transcript_14252/g.43769  ORF Transcript_14252/g.43769 Transcript_14252/m.43769 type:complete len:96 (+) Transcript_14252:1040-1327(+)
MAYVRTLAFVFVSEMALPSDEARRQRILVLSVYTHVLRHRASFVGSGPNFRTQPTPVAAALTLSTAQHFFLLRNCPLCCLSFLPPSIPRLGVNRG